MNKLPRPLSFRARFFADAGTPAAGSLLRARYPCSHIKTSELTADGQGWIACMHVKLDKSEAGTG